MSPATRSALDNLAALQAAAEEARCSVHGDILPARPPGAITIYDYMGATPMPRQTAHGQLKRLVASGAWEQVMVYERDSQGRRVVMAMYRKKGHAS